MDTHSYISEPWHKTFPCYNERMYWLSASVKFWYTNSDLCDLTIEPKRKENHAFVSLDPGTVPYKWDC